MAEPLSSVIGAFNAVPVRIFVWAENLPGIPRIGASDDRGSRGAVGGNAAVAWNAAANTDPLP
ncbi:MAG TPA: hypothetical protein VMG81_02125 [Thermoplasmata archaeon]|nr:hypothetical protein [Thermoplasmata archaeon]